MLLNDLENQHKRNDSIQIIIMSSNKFQLHFKEKKANSEQLSIGYYLVIYKNSSLIDVAISYYLNVLHFTCIHDNCFITYMITTFRY